jgi:hypothetical protein
MVPPSRRAFGEALRWALLRLEGFGLGLSYRMAVHTLRMRVFGVEHLAAVGGTTPVILAVWHGQTHLLLPIVHRLPTTKSRLTILPDDERGVTLGAAAGWVNFEGFPISMQDNSLGGARRLLALLRRLEGGDLLMINPDGPYGPPRVAKSGLAFLAQRSGAVVLPMGSTTRTCYRLRRWDRYALPLPFSRVTVVVRPPLTAGPDEPRATVLTRITDEMNAALKEAESWHNRAI